MELDTAKLISPLPQGMEHNFNIFTEGQFFNTRYDMDSVMQYDEFSFTTNGQPTIEFLAPNPNAVLTDRQRERFGLVMTSSDIAAVRQFYGCSAGTTPTPVANRPRTSNFSDYSFTLTNNLAVSVNVFFVALSGRERLFFGIAPGRSQTQARTFRENRWVVRGTNFERTFFVGEGQFAGRVTNINLSALV